MAYEPRASFEILRDLVAGVVARSELTDITTGSVLSQILTTVAAEISNVEFRLAKIRDSFFFETLTGQDLDDRVAELPPQGISRLPATNATGGGLTLHRAQVLNAQGVGTGVSVDPNAFTVPQGAVFGRIDSDTLYRTIEDVTFAVGLPSAFSATVVCFEAGIVGNCPAGTLTKMISVPREIVSFEQTVGIVGGQSFEPDNQLRSRAKQYLASLARCQPTAIEYAVKSFISSDGIRVQYASLFEDPHRRGYSEVIVDDGSAFADITRAGVRADGVVPRGGITILSHERPATHPIMSIKRFDVNNAPLDDLSPDQYISIPERGIVYVVGESFDVGDRWVIEDYEVFGGSLIPELQAMIEGDLDSPVENPGLRAAGTRIRVVPPQVQEIGLDVHVVPLPGLPFVDVANAVEDIIVEYVATLSPGEPLFAARIYDRIMDLDDVLNSHLYESATVEAFQDKYPGGGALDPDNPGTAARTVIRTNKRRITIVPEQENI